MPPIRGVYTFPIKDAPYLKETQARARVVGRGEGGGGGLPEKKVGTKQFDSNVGLGRRAEDESPQAVGCVLDGHANTLSPTYNGK